LNKHITYKNCPIHFTQQGKGRTVVLLHGFLENSGIWQDISEVLSQRYRVVCVDLLGHGQTGSLGYVHTMTAQAHMVKAVLNHLRIRKVVLVGHSMGGYVALAFAKLYLNNVKGICLLNSTSLADSQQKKTDRVRAINLVKQNHKSFIKIAIPSLFSDTNYIIFKAEIQSIIIQALQTSKQGIVAALEGMKQRRDLTSILQNNNIKTLLFIGKEDAPDKTTLFLKALNACKNKAQIVKLSGKHMGFIENKQEVSTALNQFCRQCFK